MDKRAKNILYLLGFFILVLIVVEVTRPTPINWNPSFTASDKIPLGSFVLYEELPGLFPNTEITKVDQNPYVFLLENEPAQNSVYLFINSAISLDAEEYTALMKYVDQGNTLFIAANHFGGMLSDSLNFTTRTSYTALEKELAATYYSPSLIAAESKFKKRIKRTYFTEIDTLQTRALGYFKDHPEDEQEFLNFIHIPKGNGNIYIHTMPEAFGNYYLLKNQDYAAAALSYLKGGQILWDDYKKDGRKIIDSPMRFVLNEVPLKWTYYLLMTGLLLFILFKGKREQRIIPVIIPLENTSVEFTRTIGGLYFHHRDYSNIIAKKITYFLEQVRSQYYLDTGELNAEFIHKLAVKSSNSEEETAELIQFIRNLKSKMTHTETDLTELNKKIEKFNN